MRRAPIVLTGTVAGFAAVVSFKAHDPKLEAATASAPAPPAAATTPSTGSSSSSGSSTGDGTATGDVIPTRYGNAQVRVTVTGGRITQLVALQLQGDDPKSVQISSSAEPLLRQSALAKQSGAVDMVSGATVTSTSYEASLQSALDKLGYQAPDGSRGSTTVPDIPQEHDGPQGGLFG